MGLEISEAMYAGLSKIGTTRLKEAAKNTEAFNELFPDAVSTFKNTATDAGGLIESFISEINDLNKEIEDLKLKIKLNQKIIKNLERKALNLRQKTFNAFIKKGEAHLGGSFSMIEPLLIIYEIFLKK